MNPILFSNFIPLLVASKSAQAAACCTHRATCGIRANLNSIINFISRFNVNPILFMNTTFHLKATPIGSFQICLGRQHAERIMQRVEYVQM